LAPDQFRSIPLRIRTRIRIRPARSSVIRIPPSSARTTNPKSQRDRLIGRPPIQSLSSTIPPRQFRLPRWAALRSRR
jgi:hypothetical protein